MDSFSLFLVCGFPVEALYCFSRLKLMSIKMAMVLTSFHMHLTCQEKKQVDAISMNIFGKEVCVLPPLLAFKKECFPII